MVDEVHSVPGLWVGGCDWFAGRATGGFELNRLARIIWRCVEGQQERSFTPGRHVVAMTDALRNDDEIPDGGECGVGACGHGHLAFEDVKFVVGVWMKMQTGTARDLDIIHARFRAGVEGPKPHRGAGVSAAITNDIRTVNECRSAVALVWMARRGWLFRQRGGADQNGGQQAEAGETRRRRGSDRKQFHMLEMLCEPSAVSVANLTVSMNRGSSRQVLECASLSAFAARHSAASARRRLALWRWRRANQKRQRTGAVQDALVISTGNHLERAFKLPSVARWNHRGAPHLEHRAGPPCRETGWSWA